MILAVTFAGAGLVLVFGLFAYFKSPWFRKSVSNPDNFPHYLTALFTLILAVFVLYAWRATQGQLTAMQTDQRPFIWAVEIKQPPTYEDASEQIYWEIGYTNIGKGIAYHVVIRAYIKVGDERYEPARNLGDHPLELGPSRPKMMPPNLPFLTYSKIASRPGINKDYFNKLMNLDHALGILLDFNYSDASGQNPFTTAYCIERLASGTFSSMSPEDCSKK